MGTGIPEMPAGWILLLGCWFIGAGLTIILYRAGWTGSLYQSWAWGSATCLCLYAAWSILVGEFSWIRISSLIFLLVPLFHLFNMAVTARRVRICVALWHHSKGLVEKELTEALRLGSVAGHRVRILRQFGQVRVHRDRVTLVRDEFLFLANFLEFMKKKLGLPPIL